MIKSVIVGFVLLFISIIAALVKGGEWAFSAKISGITGLLFFIISGTLSGGFVGGNQRRANYYMDSRDERIKKRELAFNMFLIGLPSIVWVVIIYVYILK